MDIISKIFSKQPVLYLLEDKHYDVGVQLDLVEQFQKLITKNVYTIFLENISYGSKISSRERAWTIINTVDRKIIPATIYLRSLYTEDQLSLIGVEDKSLMEHAHNLEGEIQSLKSELKNIWEIHGGNLYEELSVINMLVSASMNQKTKDQIKRISKQIRNNKDAILKRMPERNKKMASNIKKEVKSRKLKSAAFICGSAHYHIDPHFGNLFRPDIKLQLILNPNIEINRPFNYNDIKVE